MKSAHTNQKSRRRFDVVKAKDSRRGFIKGTIAGLIGGLFMLRGAEPSQAISGELPFQQIRMTAREIQPRLSAADEARYLYLAGVDEPTEEEILEMRALDQERLRLSQLGNIRNTESQIEAYDKARVRSGNCVVISYPIIQYGILIWIDAIVVRNRTGAKPMLEYFRQRFVEERALYEEQFGDYPL